MEDILLRVGSQAANFAIRSGLAYASKFAFVQVGKYIQGAPNEAAPELEKLRKRLENKIRIVTPAIDLIERIAARGNTSLASTVQLTTALRHDINEFGKRIIEATETQNTTKTKGKTDKQNINAVLESMRDLLRRIEDAVPLISLALTTSGANLSSSLPDTVSPSRLLQASALIRDADTAFDQNHHSVQVGPTFIVKYYSIFTAHSRVASVKDIQWKEEYAKCRVSVVRVPSRVHQKDGESSRRSSTDGVFTLAEAYEYELRLTEDLDDGRYHEELEDWSKSKTKSVTAEKGFIEGRIRHIPVHKIARLFYEHAGILLNLGESLSPVLIAKIQHGAPHPQTVLEKFTNGGDESEDDIFGDLADGFETEEEAEEEAGDKGARMGDIEWIAFEVYEEDDSDDEEDLDEETEDATEDLLPAMSALNLDASPISSSPPEPVALSGTVIVDPSLSLLEYVLRLAALQTFEQQSHMTLSDEHIVLFLRDDNPASRQPPTLEQERAPRRRSSIASISSDFSTRGLHATNLPISPPHSDEFEHSRTINNPSHTPTSLSSPVPSEKRAEKKNRNPRTHLERAMAADYDPMTLMTPLSNRRVTRSRLRKAVLMPKIRKSESRGTIHSAPNSLQKRLATAENQGKTANHVSPLISRSGNIPNRRSVSAAGHSNKRT